MAHIHAHPADDLRRALAEAVAQRDAGNSGPVYECSHGYTAVYREPNGIARSDGQPYYELWFRGGNFVLNAMLPSTHRQHRYTVDAILHGVEAHPCTICGGPRQDPRHVDWMAEES